MVCRIMTRSKINVTKVLKLKKFLSLAPPLCTKKLTVNSNTHRQYLIFSSPSLVSHDL